MRRLFDLWRRAGPAVHAAVPDAELLRRFADHRDADAFAQLLARHGPLVYGVCRRLLPDPLDVEDAFQATFLVLVRRAETVSGRALGPWLHRVAVWTARNLRRRNAARLAVTVPLREAAATPQAADARLDVDAALAALPGKYRAAVILCHLQGWTRRELAAHLGCPESTASSLVGRGLAKLRKRLAGRDPAAVLAAAGSAAVPAGLTAAASRAATIYATSFSAAAVSPAVAALTNGVLRMFWVKKLTAAGAAVLVAAATVFGVGLAADDKPAPLPRPAPPRPAPPGGPVPPPDPATVRERERLDKELDAAKKRVDELEAKRKQLDEAEKSPPGLVITVRPENPPIVITEYTIGGKAVGSVETASAEMVARFVRRTWADLAGPKELVLMSAEGYSEERFDAVLAALRAAGHAPNAVARRFSKAGSAPARPGTDPALKPVVGYFRGIEPYRVPYDDYPFPMRVDRQGIVITDKPDGSTFNRYLLAENVAVVRELTNEKLDLKTLKPGQAVNLYRAAGPASNPPVVRIGVPDAGTPAAKAKPAYVIEPPDLLLIEAFVRSKSIGPEGAAASRPLPIQQITGQFLVRPDGTVGLGFWGSVAVNGLTIDQATEAIRKHLAARPEFKELGVEPAQLVAVVDVKGFNSKRYYLIVDGGDGEQVTALPVTGTDTVLDALSGVGMTGLADSTVWVHRMGKPGEQDQTLPVDWKGITRGGNAATNYALQPGDRIFVKRKK